MTRELYKKLAAGCGAIAIVATMGTTALAFDEVNWVWNADVITTVETSTIAITELAPTGLNQAENEQETRGNISSTSEVNAFSAAPDVNLTSPSLATDLGRIETSAQAMGNSASISSDVQINYDSSQIFGGVDPETFGTVTAESSALTITNAAVDTSATAVANNLTVDLDYATSDDAIAIGNNVQTAMADVTATSTADTVSIAGFTGLGALPDPVVSSSSTAVGNNFSVNVQQAEAPVVALLPI